MEPLVTSLSPSPSLLSVVFSARQHLTLCSLLQKFSLAPPTSLKWGQGKGKGRPHSLCFSLPLCPLSCLLCEHVFLCLALPLKDSSLGESHLDSVCSQVVMSPCFPLHFPVTYPPTGGYLLTDILQVPKLSVSQTELVTFLQKSPLFLLHCLSR